MEEGFQRGRGRLRGERPKPRVHLMYLEEPGQGEGRRDLGREGEGRGEGGEEKGKEEGWEEGGWADRCSKT